MAKLTLNTIGSRYGSIDALNDNFNAIEQAIENTFSLDGTSPNALEADLDMNSNDILNAGEVSTDSLRINGVLVEPTTGVTAGAAFQTYEFTATAGQTSFSVSPTTPYNASIVVIVNGLQLSPAEVNVSGTNVITPALTLGDEVVIRRYTSEPVAAPDASEVNFIQAGTGAVTRTSQNKMRDIVNVKDFGAVGDGVADDTVAIQTALTAMSGTGVDVFLLRGTYKVSSALLVPTLTGLVSDGSATLYAVNSGFNNTNPSVSGRYVNNGVVINLSGQTTTPYTSNYGQKISGLKIQYQYAVGYSVNAIVARNCYDLEISNNEIYDFPLCRAIMVASLQGSSKIVNNHIHDLENNYVFPGYGFAERGQFNETGIDVDEDRVNSVWSDNLIIDGNYIEDVHYGATAIATYEDQSDGITLRNASGIRVTNNTVIDTNEGIDLQGFNTLVVGNVFSNCTGYGVKLIHGARYNIVNANRIYNSGLGAILVVGGLLSEGDTSFNVFSSNTIEGVDPTNLHSGSSTACIRIQNQATTSVASNNTFVSNHIDPGVYGEYIVYNQTAGDVKNRFDGNLVQRSAVTKDFYIGASLNAQVIQQIATNIYGYASGVDGVNTATWKLVQLNAELFDTNSEFNTSTYTWTCKTPGYYRFVAQVGLTSSNGIQIKLRKNATDYAYSRPPIGSGTSNQTASLTVTAYADIGDVFDVYVYHSTGVAAVLTIGAETTYLCVSKV